MVTLNTALPGHRSDQQFFVPVIFYPATIQNPQMHGTEQ